MALPKICTNKFFLMAVTASFAFSTFLYGVLDAGINEVKADNNQDIDRIVQIVDKSSDKIENIQEDVAFIRGKIEKLE